MLVERKSEVSLVTELSVSAAWARHIRHQESPNPLCMVHFISSQMSMCC